MGSWASRVWWGGDPDAVHPVSGLSRRDAHAVQRSWAPVYADAVPNGMEILKRFFKDYPDTREFFRMIRNIPEEEYATNAQFKAHVINLMTSLNSAIINLHQPEVVAAMMQKVGEAHKKRKIQRKHFLDLKTVLVKIFVEVLQFDQATLAAWSRAVDFLYKNIFETLESDEQSR